MDLDHSRFKLIPHEREHCIHLELCRCCGGGSHFAKECQAPSLQQKILYLEQQHHTTGKTEANPKSNVGAYTRKEVLALPTL